MKLLTIIEGPTGVFHARASRNPEALRELVSRRVGYAHIIWCSMVPARTNVRSAAGLLDATRRGATRRDMVREAWALVFGTYEPGGEPSGALTAEHPADVFLLPAAVMTGSASF